MRVDYIWGPEIMIYDWVHIGHPNMNMFYCESLLWSVLNVVMITNICFIWQFCCQSINFAQVSPQKKLFWAPQGPQRVSKSQKNLSKTLAYSGRFWLTLADPGRLWMTFDDSGWLWLTLADSGWLWLSLDDSGWPWLTLEDCGLLKLTLANSDRLWRTLADYGWLWLNLADSGCF